MVLTVSVWSDFPATSQRGSMDEMTTVTAEDEVVVTQVSESELGDYALMVDVPPD